jgi:hypothetical protein
MMLLGAYSIPSMPFRGFQRPRDDLVAQFGARGGMLHHASHRPRAILPDLFYCVATQLCFRRKNLYES